MRRGQWSDRALSPRTRLDKSPTAGSPAPTRTAPCRGSGGCAAICSIPPSPPITGASSSAPATAVSSSSAAWSTPRKHAELIAPFQECRRWSGKCRPWRGKRSGEVRVQYEILAVDPFLTAQDFERLTFDLDIGKFEMNRTHWAVKEVDLPKVLKAIALDLAQRAETDVVRNSLVSPISIEGLPCAHIECSPKDGKEARA